MKKAIAILLITTACMTTVKAEATPLSGVNKKMAEETQKASLRPPVTEWRQEILDIMSEPEEPVKKSKKKKQVKKNYIYASENTLNKRCGVFQGPSGKESYYNLPMARVVEYMHTLQYRYPYWVRNDGVKMLGDYVMVAADLRIRPKGTILKTSLGDAIVCDTGAFVKNDSTALDVATAW